MRLKVLFSFHSLLILFLQQALCFDGFFSNEWLLVAKFTIHEAEEFAKRHGLGEVTEIENYPGILRKLLSAVMYNTCMTKRRTLAQQISVTKKSVFTISYFAYKVNLFERQQWHNVSLREVPVKDPLWPNMWYMNRNDSVSMRIREAWGSGFSGRGVNIAVVDNGIETNHPDLIDRYDGTYSIDVHDNDRDPSPGPDERHGTNCAGVAVASNNSVCVIGPAFASTLIGIRLIGPLGVTDAGKIQAFSNAATHVSSNSWGSSVLFDELSPVVKSALQFGAENLRRGLGIVYVFAGGNKGSDNNCNMDGYVNSIYTIAINSVSRSFRPPGYAEPCTAILASTFSGPGSNTDNICTTELGGACINTFSGTSASAAMASGIVALVLEANPSLSWRDMQELIIVTSKHDGLLNGDFKKNAMGRHVSDWFGYGLMDAEAMINAASNWTCLPEHHVCSSGSIAVNKQIILNDPLRIVESTITTNGCNRTKQCVNRVEHVEAEIRFQTSLRGAVLLYLESPMGTTSQLLTRRNDDRANNVDQTWTYMSVHHWGENPAGTWKIIMSLEYDWKESGNLVSWTLVLYGTGEGCSPHTSSTSFSTNSTCSSRGSIGTTDSVPSEDTPACFENTKCFVPIVVVVPVVFVLVVSILLCVFFFQPRSKRIKSEIA